MDYEQINQLFVSTIIQNPTVEANVKIIGELKLFLQQREMVLKAVLKAFRSWQNKLKPLFFVLWNKWPVNNFYNNCAGILFAELL